MKLLTINNGTLYKYLYDGGYCSFDNNTPTSHYYNRDHLGNIREVVSENGTIEQVTHYYPFGAPYSDSSVTNPALQPYKYNSKEFDTTHKFFTYDYGARQYDPLLAVWHGVDPMCEKDYRIGVNVYCHNNPVKLIDTDGEVPTIVVGAIVGAGMDYSLQVITNVFSGKGISSFTDVDGKSIMISAVAGAAGGGLISKANKMSKMTARLADVAINASEGVASTVNDKISNGEKVTVADVAKGAAKGVVAGAIGEKAGEIKRNITLKSPKQKMLNQQADHYRRVARGPNARKSRVERAQKAQREAKENVDNREVAVSTVASNIINELINQIEELLK